MRRITVDISAVSGEHYYTAVVPEKDQALKFLQHYDHEGSSISVMSILMNAGEEETLELNSDNPEEIYTWLNASTPTSTAKK
jgi:hypothetical protein